MENANLALPPMTNTAYFDEKSLLLHLKNDDSEAYIRLYNHYQPLLYPYILRFAKKPSLAEDVVQDVFLKIWEVRRRIDPELSFKAYLYRISRNQVFKLMKKIASDEALRQEVMLHINTTDAPAHVQLQWKQYQEVLNATINQLPPQRQKIFRLCREQGKTYEEVAAQLGISRNTVKEHMVMAMKFVKAYFNKHGDHLLLFTFLFLTGKRH